MKCPVKVMLRDRSLQCALSEDHEGDHKNSYAEYSTEGLIRVLIQWPRPGQQEAFPRSKVPRMRAGHPVRLADGRVGKLSTPRGCYCGLNGEECWDIALDEGGGVQAHGGTFSLVEKS